MTTAAPPTALGPIGESRRVAAIDAARGLALLGILFVNAVFFGEPMDELTGLSAPHGEGPLSVAVYYLTQVFCTGKFYPLFSLLFGAGMAVMLDSAGRPEGVPRRAVLRRLVLLGLFGLAHIVLLSHGDVLLVYAGCGLVMTLLVWRSPRTLLRFAAGFFAVGVVFSVAAGILFAALSPAGPPVAAEMPAGATALDRYIAVLGDDSFDGPYDPRLPLLETEIVRNGPFAHVAALRGLIYVETLAYMLLVMVWQILAMFCLGAALMKLGFFHGALPAWRGRLVRLGLAVGLPAGVAFAALYERSEGPVWGPLTILLVQVGGPVMSLMYLSLVMGLVERGPWVWATSALALAGRMALTCYILESVLMQAVFSHWGLAQFGQWTWAQRAGLAVAVSAACVALAGLWMRAFRFGPLEYLWRTLTYLRVQPLLRRGAA